MSITDRQQIRAARKLLGWSLATLAKRTGVAYRSVGKLEAGVTLSRSENEGLAAIRLALEQAGIVFTHGDPPGVQLEPPMTLEQCKQARALLGWPESTLARKAQRTVGTITRAEAGKLHSDLLPAVMASARHAFKTAGVEFHDDGPCTLKRL